MPRRIGDVDGAAAVHAWLAGHRDRANVATAVRFTLQSLADAAPGQSLEVRVPPFGAVQAITGTHHRRGTPPAVVEMAADVWLALATGERAWSDATAAGDVAASGERADLAALLPLELG